MKQPHIIFKIAAVTSSVLLVSGLIAYKAGVFASLVQKEEPATSDDTTTYETLFYGSKSAEVVPVPTVQQNTTESTTPPLMAGSKSAPVVPPALFPGSKSAGVITRDLDIPIRPKQGATQAPAPQAPVAPPANSPTLPPK
jgi:hypothetical protein